MSDREQTTAVNAPGTAGRFARTGHPEHGPREPDDGLQLVRALPGHVKAAPLHPCQAENLAEIAGTDPDASEHQVPEADLFRAAGDTAKILTCGPATPGRHQADVPQVRRCRFPDEPAFSAWPPRSAHRGPGLPPEWPITG